MAFVRIRGGVEGRVQLVPAERAPAAQGEAAHATLPSPAPLELRARTASADRGVWLGLNRDFRIGDPAFDRALYVDCDAPTAHLEAALGDPVLRRDLAHHLIAEKASLHLDERGTLSLRLLWSTPLSATSGDGLTDQKRDELETILAGIASRLPTFTPGHRPTRALVVEWCLVVAVISPLAAGLGSLLLSLYWPLFVGWEHHAASALAGVASVVPAWLLAFVGFRKLGNGYWFWRTFVIATLIAAPFFGLGAARIVNCAFDDSPVRTRVVDVVEARSTYSAKSGTSHTLVIRSWRSGAQTEELRSPPFLDAQGKIAKRVAVRTRAGVLGAEWLLGVGPAGSP